MLSSAVFAQENGALNSAKFPAYIPDPVNQAPRLRDKRKRQPLCAQKPPPRSQLIG